MRADYTRQRYARIARDNPDNLPNGSVIVVLDGRATLIVNDDGTPMHIAKIINTGAR